MKKLFVVGIILILLAGAVAPASAGILSDIIDFFFPSQSPGDNWTIDGDTVYMDDANAYLSATPHTLSCSGWVYFNLTSKTYSGNIDVVWGFDRPNVKPTKAELYAPYWNNWTTYHERFFYNVSSILLSSDSCGVGNDYNTYHRNITYQTPIYNYTSFEIDGYETISSIVCFDSYLQNGTNYTAYWHTNHSQLILWKDLSSSFTKVNYDYGGMNTWYYVKGVSVAAGETYQIRALVDVPVTTEGVSGKYWWAVKPSSETISEAISNDHFYALDPWYSASWSKKRPILINNTGGGALSYYQVGDGTGRPLNITYDSDMNANFSDIRVVNDTSGTTVPYWIESQSDGEWCNIWFNATAIPADSWTNDTYYLYYGNAEASSASNGVNTFITFLDDAQSELDPNNQLSYSGDTTIFTGLQVRSTNAYAYKTSSAVSNFVANGQFTIDSQVPESPQSVYGWPFSAMAEIQTAIAANANNHISIFYLSSSPGYSDNGIYIYGAKAGVAGSGLAYAPLVLGTTYYWKIVYVKGTSATMYVYSDITRETQIGTAALPGANVMNIDADTFYSSNTYNTGILSTITGTSAKNRVRKYASPEPTAELGDEESAPVTITLLSQTPSLLYQNTTGIFNVSWGISHPSATLNNTSVSFIYTNLDTGDSSYNHSIRPPENNRTALWLPFGEKILRADNRNDSLNFEYNATITGGNVYEWGGGDENVSRMEIVPVNDTYTKVYWNGTIQDTVSSSMWYLDRTDIQNATKTEYTIYKGNGLLTKIWDIESIEGHDDYILNVWIDSHLGVLSPNKPVQIWYLNESYDPEGAVDPLDSPYSFYVTSHNATQWTDYIYSPRISTYVNAFYVNQTAVEAGGVVMTNTSWIYLESSTGSSKPYYVNTTNAVSTTNRTFAETNVTYSGEIAPLTEIAYTANIFAEFKHDGHQFQMKLFAADSDGHWGNSSLETTNIGEVNFPPTTPSILHFWYNDEMDSNMNTTYNGEFNITVGVGTDPDGGDTIHNLTLHYGNETYVATINNTFNASQAVGGIINITFDSVTYYSAVDNYTLKIVSTDTTGLSSYSWLATNFTLQPKYTISGYVIDQLANTLETVAVEDNESINSTSTNITGYYSLSSYYNGTYNISFTKAGFDTGYLEVVVAGDITNQNATLYDTTSPTITIEVPPTPANESEISVDYANISAIIADEGSNYTTAFNDWNQNATGFGSLVGWWKMDDTAGTYVTDSSPWNNSGTWSGSTSVNWTTGKFGSALNFDGNDYADCGNGTSLNTITDAISIGAIVKSPDLSTYRGIACFQYYTEAGIKSYALFLDSSGRINFQLNDKESISKSGYDDDIFHYVLVTWAKGGTLDIYIDGIEVSYEIQETLSVDIIPSEHTFEIGIFSLTSQPTFNGTIDDVRIYNLALSNDEINASYNASANKYIGNFSDLENGQYNYTLYAMDKYGNVNTTFQTFEVAVITDTTFTVSLPIGYTYPSFHPPNSTATNYPPEGQNDSQEFFNVTNTGNVNLDIRMQLNATVSTITLKADSDNNSDGAKEVNTTLVTIYANLLQGGYANIWLWSDFDHTPEQTANRTVYINVSQT